MDRPLSESRRARRNGANRAQKCAETNLPVPKWLFYAILYETRHRRRNAKSDKYLNDIIVYVEFPIKSHFQYYFLNQCYYYYMRIKYYYF